MKILAIDTACSACSVGVLTAEGVIAARSELMMRGHAESLMPMVRSVLADAECEFSDVSLIAVTVGPGSFTGIRTGLAAARGLGVALGVQVSGVTTLEAIAAATISSATVTGKPCILAAIETRRTDLYVQLFESEPGPGGVPRPVDAPKALAPVDAVALLPDGPVLLAGDGADRLCEQAPARFRERIERVPEICVPAISAVASIAAARLGDPLPAAPLYIHSPAVRRPGEAVAASAP